MKWMLTGFSALALMLIPSLASAQDLTVPDIAAETDDAGDSFPVHFSTGLSSSLGGSVLTAGAFQGGFVVPSFSQSIPLNMSWRLPEVDFLPRLSLSAGTGISIGWLSTAFSGNGGAGDRIPRIGDFRLGLGFGDLFKEPFVTGQGWTKVSISGNASVRLPMSLASRTQNLTAAAGIGGRIGWSTASLEFWPKFIPLNFGYAPSFGANGYSETSSSIPCDTPPDFNVGLFGTGDPAVETIGIPLRIPRAKEILPNGECRLIGRQSIASFNQAFFVGTGFKNHSLSVSFSYGMAYLRPLGGDPKFRSVNASDQDFGDFTSGSVAYGYDIPDEAMGINDWVDTSLSLVLASGQPVWSLDNKRFRFPWWDFESPNNGFSSLGVSLGATF